LAQGDEIGERRFAQPLSAGHEFRAKITQMRDRAAERGQPELQERQEDFARAGHGSIQRRLRGARDRAMKRRKRRLRAPERC
jgi:hypothetical protein